VLIVEAGNFSDVQRPGADLKSDFAVRIMNRIGYDAMTLGERELRFGVERYLGAGVEAPPVVLTNLYRRTDGGAAPVGRRSLVRDIGGVRVGVFGILDSGVLLKSETSTQFTLGDVFGETEAVVSELESEGAEIIVMLSQVELAVTDSLLRRVPGIDVVAMGHPTAQTRLTHMTVGNTIVVQAGTRGQNLGYLDLTIDPSGEIVEYAGRSVPLEKQIRDDPSVVALVGELKAEMGRAEAAEQQARDVEYRNQQKVDRYLGAGICARCHQAEFERWSASAHASAWKSLSDLGMETNEECVTCHVTGWGVETGFFSPRIAPDLTGVQCESCHGMGTLHGTSPDRTGGAGRCSTCHDQANSPNFDLDAYMQKIKHWD
jgi:hypothetical protein